MSSAKCCVLGCLNSRVSKDILHKFPNHDKNKDIFNTWVYSVGGDILHLENEHIFKYRRVCHIHFEEKYHCRNNRLSSIAVPTKNMPGLSLPSELLSRSKDNCPSKKQSPDVTAVETSLDEIPLIIDTTKDTEISENNNSFECITTKDTEMQEDENSSECIMSNYTKIQEVDISFKCITTKDTEMTRDTEKKLPARRCKCCLADKELKNMWHDTIINSECEVYGKLLKECFYLNWDVRDTEYICEACIKGLSDAVTFKKVFLKSQKVLEKVAEKNYIVNKLPDDAVNGPASTEEQVFTEIEYLEFGDYTDEYIPEQCESEIKKKKKKQVTTGQIKKKKKKQVTTGQIKKKRKKQVTTREIKKKKEIYKYKMAAKNAVAVGVSISDAAEKYGVPDSMSSTRVIIKQLNIPLIDCNFSSPSPNELGEQKCEDPLKLDLSVEDENNLVSIKTEPDLIYKNTKVIDDATNDKNFNVHVFDTKMSRGVASDRNLLKDFDAQAKEYSGSNNMQPRVIITEGYIFAMVEEFPNGLTKWRCRGSTSKCQAIVYTVNSHVVHAYDKHNHN